MLHAKRVVAGSPSTPSDLYIKKIMKEDVADKGLVVVGFEIE
ncbi:MAG: hypothetical protein QW612_03890 [Candidatus Bathyarchaeia archaeon]